MMTSSSRVRSSSLRSRSVVVGAVQTWRRSTPNVRRRSISPGLGRGGHRSSRSQAGLLQRGDSLMVGAELIDVRDNKQIWGEQYNRKLADALAVQQEISRDFRAAAHQADWRRAKATQPARDH